MEKHYEIKSIVGIGSHEEVTWITLEDYEDNIITIELPTVEMLNTFSNQYMNHALDILHKHLKKEINGDDRSI
jgi:hypothetical protein